MAKKSRSVMRQIRHERIRKTVIGTAEKPRLAVYRSNKHLVAQIIDDASGNTLAAASTHEKDLKSKGNLDGAKAVGKALAKRAKDKGLKQVIFDRGGFQYQGRVAAIADGAREEGLEF